MRSWAAIILLGVACSQAAPGPAAGAEASNGDGPVRVQMGAFMVPVRQAADGSLRYTPITTFLHVPSRQDVAAVCRLTPRMRDAFLQVLFDRPIAMTANGEADFGDVGPRLVTAGNRTLGRDLISEVELVLGATQKKIGGAKFASSIPCSEATKKTKGEKKE